AHHRVLMYSLLGELVSDVELPSIGAVASMSGNPEDADFFLSFYSFLFPRQNYRYDFDRGQLELFQKTDTPFDPSHYVVRQIF
ncbi:MAG: S9 family peptidase, partial [Gammaproteobacteria bacterium]|nr:S9 family peptidase [Gammaproteobacteria bacterium]